jgi:voltage-gated potassium channel
MHAEVSATHSGLRDRFNEFVETHEVAWELVMAALASAFVVVGFADEDNPAPAVVALDAGLTLVFILEFCVRLLASRDRRGYLRGHWIDLVAIIPTVRGARLLRLLRLLRLVRAFAGVYRSLTRFERVARHRGLVILFVAWLGVAAICAAALYFAEVGINPNMQTPLDALWWGVVTLTTVGYGDIYPTTPEGRLAGAALMILGITLFATITGTITSVLVAEGDGPRDLPNQLQALARLHGDGELTDAEFQLAKARLLDAADPT